MDFFHKSLVIGKLGLMHVCKGSSQISLCSKNILITDETFRLYCVFVFSLSFLSENLIIVEIVVPDLACVECIG